GFARLLELFISQREIVMRIGVCGRQRDGGVIRLSGLFHPAGFIENVAQVEVAKRIAAVNFDGLAVVTLGGRKILPIVVERSEVNVSGGVRRIELKNALV